MNPDPRPAEPLDLDAIIGDAQKAMIGSHARDDEIEAARRCRGHVLRLVDEVESLFNDNCAQLNAINNKDRLIDELRASLAEARRTTVEGVDLKQFEGHTPGPWEVDYEPGWISLGVHAGDTNICDIADMAYSIDDYDLPNARLMAAAPTLLALLRTLPAAVERRVREEIAGEIEAEAVRWDSYANEWANRINARGDEHRCRVVARTFRKFAVVYLARAGDPGRGDGGAEGSEDR
jgi:hypothetical protein